MVTWPPRGAARRPPAATAALALALALAAAAAPARSQSGGELPQHARQQSGRARLAAPVFAETFRATAVSIDARTHDVYDITIWHDRKRNAERLDDHTTNTSYLFSYAKGMLYTTRRNRCTATRVSPTMAAPRMPRESPLLASDLEDVNGMDGVEHWSNPGGRSPDWEEVWVVRKGRTCEPVRERYRRHASAAAQQTAPLRAADDESKGDGGDAEWVEVQVDYTSFEAGRLDPAIFKVPAESGCAASRGKADIARVEAIAAQRSLLHASPMHVVAPRGGWGEEGDGRRRGAADELNPFEARTEL